jgi:hypothetical protein
MLPGNFDLRRIFYLDTSAAGVWIRDTLSSFERKTAGCIELMFGMPVARLKTD